MTMISTWMRSEEPDDAEPEATPLCRRPRQKPLPSDAKADDLAEIPDEQEPNE
jgi:hypothetical protein